MRIDRFTLAAITVAAVTAAFLAATWIPTVATPGPLLTWTVVYLCSVLGLAKALRLPPARTLYAATLMTVAAVHLALTVMRHVLDGLMQLTAQLNAAGVDALATTPQKAA